MFRESSEEQSVTLKHESFSLPFMQFIPMSTNCRLSSPRTSKEVTWYRLQSPTRNDFRLWKRLRSTTPAFSSLHVLGSTTISIALSGSEQSCSTDVTVWRRVMKGLNGG